MGGRGVIWQKVQTKNTMQNEKGLDYSFTDGYNSISLTFKHKESKELCDGFLRFNQRTLKVRSFYKMADAYLANYLKEVPMPKECIIMKTYYDFTGKLAESIDAEKLKLGTSLLSGKIGQKLFADDFTLMHDVTEKNCWMNPFWDGEGVVNKGDKVTFIKNGKLLRGYADKKTAKNEQVKILLANFDLNSSQKCNKMITEAEEEEGRENRLVFWCFSLVKTKRYHLLLRNGRTINSPFFVRKKIF